MAQSFKADGEFNSSHKQGQAHGSVESCIRFLVNLLKLMATSVRLCGKANLLPMMEPLIVQVFGIGKVASLIVSIHLFGLRIKCTLQSLSHSLKSNV